METRKFGYDKFVSGHHKVRLIVFHVYFHICIHMFQTFQYPLIWQKEGFFIEAGAFDGEMFSNSLYYELKQGWTGLLVEPNPDAFSDLVKIQSQSWCVTDIDQQSKMIIFEPLLTTASFIR